MASPTSRTLNLLRNTGWIAAIAESWIPHANLRRDLFGLFDIVAIHPGQQGTLGVQTTSASNHSARRTKLLESAVLPIWLKAGNAAEVWSWSQRDGKWEVRREALTLADTDGVTATPLTPRRRPRRQRRGERQGSLFPVGGE
jgi:hypothetical protein